MSSKNFVPFPLLSPWDVLHFYVIYTNLSRTKFVLSKTKKNRALRWNTTNLQPKQSTSKNSYCWNYPSFLVLLHSDEVKEEHIKPQEFTKVVNYYQRIDLPEKIMPLEIIGTILKFYPSTMTKKKKKKKKNAFDQIKIF